MIDQNAVESARSIARFDAERQNAVGHQDAGAQVEDPVRRTFDVRDSRLLDPFERGAELALARERYRVRHDISRRVGIIDSGTGGRHGHRGIDRIVGNRRILAAGSLPTAGQRGQAKGIAQPRMGVDLRRGIVKIELHVGRPDADDGHVA